MTVAIIAVVVGLLGIGLAANQLMRLRTYLNKPPELPPSEPPDPD